MRAALADIPGVHLMYVAEIVPPVETAVVAFESEVSSAVDSQSAAGIWSRDRSAHL